MARTVGRESPATYVLTMGKTTTSKSPGRNRAPRGLVLEGVSFKREYRAFERGRKLVFRPGVNLVVGEQGCGKSSLFALIKQIGSPSERQRKQGREIASLTVARDKAPILSFDFEKDNPRTLSYLLDDGGIGFQLQSKFQSHGEIVRAILDSLPAKLGRKTALILLDEPDMALSPRSAHWLADQLRELASNGHQVIAAVHNPIVIASQPEVYSFEHKRWMSAEKFLTDHAETSHDKP